MIVVDFWREDQKADLLTLDSRLWFYKQGIKRGITKGYGRISCMRKITRKDADEASKACTLPTRIRWGWGDKAIESEGSHYRKWPYLLANANANFTIIAANAIFTQFCIDGSITGVVCRLFSGIQFRVATTVNSTSKDQKEVP